jgi:cytochrome c
MKDKILNQIQKILNNKDRIDSSKHLAKATGLALITALLVTIITNSLYQEKSIFQRGYKIDITKNKPSNIKSIAGISVGSLSDISPSKAINIVDLIKNANLKKGKKTFKKCAACHNAKKGASNKIGPNLFAIINKRKASASNFKYSNALKAKGGRWNYQDLNKFLAKPKDFLPGTKMTFVGLKKDKDRANVIAYLKSLNN